MHNQTLPPRAPRLAGGRRGEMLALGAALVSVTLWASAFVGIRAAGHDLSPGRKLRQEKNAPQPRRR